MSADSGDIGPKPSIEESKMSGQLKREWDEFKSRFIDTPYFSADRKKTIKAIRHLWERIPAEEMAKLPALLMVFALSYDTHSACITRPLEIVDAGKPASVLKQIDRDFVLILLAASLERKPQWEVDYKVAHAFAHASWRGKPRYKMLCDTSAYPKAEHEIEVDKLVSQWGFRSPRRSHMNNLLIMKDGPQ